MFDDERLVLDPREGERVSGSSGERAVVGVAAIALLGGLLIFAGNFLASLGADEAGRDSATATATERPSPTARPSPTPRPLREVTIAPGTPPPPRLPTDAFYGFIEAKVDLVMRDRPRVDTTEVGLLAAGELAFAEEQADGDWYHVTAPDGAGWVQVSDGSTDFAERVTTDFATGPDVWSIIAGGEGYVALASRYSPDNPSGQVVLYSPDGLAWEEAPFAARGAWTTLVAWGPAGWLAVTEHEAPAGSPGTTWVSRLADGRWDPVGSFSAIDSIYPTQLIGSDVGYLLIAQGGGRGPAPQQVVGSWFSTDGFTWREGAPIGLEEAGWITVAAVPGGFYAWNQGPVAVPRPSGGPASVSGAFSANGRAWAPVYGGPTGGTMRIVGLDDRVVAFDVDAATLAIRTWTAIVDGGTFGWRETPADDPAFAGAGVTTLAGIEDRAVAFGWDLETDAPLAWRQEGAGEVWQRTELPAEFGGIPRVAATGANGAVVVGYRPSVRSTNPIFWRETEPGAFAPEPSPVFAPVPDPTAADCTELSANPLALLFMDRSLAVACHGNAPLTFRAWAEVCIDCVAVPRQEDGGPASWMVNGEHQLWFGLGPGMGWSQSAVLDPNLVSTVNIGLGGNPGWVQVTGHFDDPRSVDCRATPIPAEYSYYAGHAEAVRTCRQQFVVTDLKPVAAP